MSKLIVLVVLVVVISTVCSGHSGKYEKKCPGKGEIWKDCGCNKDCNNWTEECNSCKPGCFCESEYTRIRGICAPAVCCPQKNCRKHCDQYFGMCERYMGDI